ncbi:MAG: DNA methyltransferase, partial [bacterium]|nr:DNA methyltransferase [bacterium]
MPEWTNKLFFGDNLDVLRRHIGDESVDLVYLDPPFNSKSDYNVLFKEVDGTPSASQFRSFADFWHWDETSARTYHELVTGGDAPPALVDLLQGFERFLGHNDMLAYLVMMAPRLVELRRVLKPTGSIYLHCDPTASHYLKLVMDSIFGKIYFKNEIVWRRSHPHGNVYLSYGRIHDVILFYSKGKDCIWTKPHKPYLLPNGELDPAMADSVLKQYSFIEEGTGRRFQPTSLLNPNTKRPNLTYEFHGHTKVWRWTKERMDRAEREGRLYFPSGGKGIPREKRYLDEQEGIPFQDFWDDIRFEKGEIRLGYQTQKPWLLLKRILAASSNEGDVVLDPFCGCGTTIAAAQALNRLWIGIDITYLAINLIKSRLADHFGDEAAYEVHGEPRDWNSARELAQRTDLPRKEFELWALSLVHARPLGDPERKGGGDRGIDGVLFFRDGKTEKTLETKKIIVQVKSDLRP